MAVVKDIENEVEIAFKTVITASDDIGSGIKVRSWRDGSSARTLPAILVHCSPVGNHESTQAGALWVANVEIAVQTDSTKDKSQSVLKNYMGAVRDVLTVASLVSSLNSACNVTFLTRGINIESGTHTIDDDEVSQMSLTVTCQITK